MFRRRAANLIAVTFVETATGSIAATTRMPATQLPDAFDQPTTMEIAGTTWTVDTADPPTRDLYEASGRLRLGITRTDAGSVSGPPRGILFSSPTILDSLPVMAPEAPGENPFELHEDHWRDVEFIHDSHDAEIATTFEAVRRIYTHHQEGPGFTAVHTRRGPTAPLGVGGIPLDEAMRLTGAEASRASSLCIGDWRGVVASGFAATAVSGLAVYGVADGATAMILGIDPWAATSDAEAAGLADLASRHHLSLVVWRQGRRLRTAGEISEWLSTVPGRH